MAALIGAVIGAAVVLAVLYGPRLWRRLRRPGRLVECAACGGVLPVRRAVVRSNVRAADDGPGGTATIAEYHRRCARRAGMLA